MATQPTQNAVPSESPRDLKFNAGKIDEFVTSMGWTYTDRFGQQHYTIEGINYIAQQAMALFGYVILTGKTFTTGATINHPNEVLLNAADGQYYKWTGSFASGGKVVPANSTPESTGGIGPGAWIGVGDASLRSDLASGGKAALVGYGSTTVKGALDELYADNTEQGGKTGFNTVGRFLNLAELRSQAPESAGMIVYVASAASSTAAEKHVGGGFFQSFDNSAAPLTDDGGIVIVPSSGSLAWRRINFSAYDMQFWGVKADGTTDNAAAITKATQYARTNRIILEAPAGNINTSEMVPIYNNMGIRGQGKAEATVFYKTTNNAFPFKKNNVTVTTVDALVGFVPESYDRADTSMASFVINSLLEGCMFRRQGLTEEAVDKVRPDIGIYLNKTGACTLREVSAEGGYIGMQGFNVFSPVLEHVSIKTWPGHGYSGVQISDFRDGIFYQSGTSFDARLVQVLGYQFAYELDRLQYSNFTSCTAESIIPLPGETVCYAFKFIDPYCITLDGCATEFVKGGQIRVTSFANPSFVRSLVVNNYLAIDQQNPVAATPIHYVDSGGVGNLKVSYIGGDLSRQSLANLAPPVVSGQNSKVVIINSGGEDWTSTGSGVFTRLA